MPYEELTPEGSYSASALGPCVFWRTLKEGA
jgi:hypothetical protein